MVGQAGTYIIEAPGLRLDMISGPLLMGILNVTPDSFSDGGEHFGISSAVARGLEMMAQGADIIDIGGESTRPGSQSVPAEEQIARVVPVIEQLRAKSNKPISIDTTRSAVAREALAAGAGIVNDISAGRADPEILELAAKIGCPIVLMHMQGTPANMQVAPHYEDVVGEIIAFLAEAIERAIARGVYRDRIIIDPGVGFGKTAQHNLQILSRLNEFRTLDRPILVGSSRKGFIGKVLDEPQFKNRIWGTAATVALAVASGANILRVHDVAAMKQVAKMAQAIISARTGGRDLG